ncbi:MAG: hypothetical protein AAGD25_12155 [Cyanobacteria bacterium P01_F01_bin.150]
MNQKASLTGLFAPFLTVCVAAVSLILTDNVATLAYSRSEYSLEHQEQELKSRINRVRKNNDSSQFNKANDLSQGHHIPASENYSLALNSERIVKAAWNNWANWANWSNWDNW